MITTEVKRINTTALAYMGDAVYEVYIRKHVMQKGCFDADRLHKAAVAYVRADGQARAVRKLMNEFLTEEEVSLVKRARNHKTASKARSADPVTYKLATAFEALVGALYLSGDMVRTEQVVYEAIRIIEEDF